MNPLRSPLDQSKSDFEIFLHLLNLLESPFPGDSPEAVFEEIERHIPFYRGIQDGEQWPKGAPYLYSDDFPIGKARLVPLEVKSSQPQPETYPFHLIQKPSLFQSGQLSLKSDALKKVSEKPYLEMNLGDAQRLKIEDGEAVQVATQKGEALRMNVRLSTRLASGVVTAPYPCSIAEEGGNALVKIERLKRG